MGPTRRDFFFYWKRTCFRARCTRFVASCARLRGNTASWRSRGVWSNLYLCVEYSSPSLQSSSERYAESTLNLGGARDPITTWKQRIPRDSQRSNWAEQIVHGGRGSE